jgi:hypothetical protein
VTRKSPVLLRICDQCGKHLVTHRADARFCNETCRTRWKNERRRKQSAPDTRVDGQGNGAGSRGGNVRDLDTARDLQAQVKDKRDWRDAIDEQIRLTLLETGYFHADDLDELRIPPEHAQLKGTRSAWFRNQGLMEKTGAERKVSHKAANGRKAPIHRITPKGRQELTAGFNAGVPSPQGAEGSSVASPDCTSVDPGGSSGEGPSDHGDSQPSPEPARPLQEGRDRQVRGAGSQERRHSIESPFGGSPDSTRRISKPARLPEGEPLSLLPEPDPEIWAA